MSPHLGVYGDATARTPILDDLAAESLRYTQAFTTAPVCSPSRSAIITGMHQASIGAHHHRTTEGTLPEIPGPYLAVPPFYVKAFPEYLRAAGYYTSNRAKTDYQFGDPFTIWPDTLLVREELARLYDNVADMDAQVGRIPAELDADGLADDTIVFFWSDHGDGVPRGKRTLYDSGLQVPLMIRWPSSIPIRYTTWRGTRSIGRRSSACARLSPTG